MAYDPKKIRGSAPVLPPYAAPAAWWLTHAPGSGLPNRPAPGDNPTMLPGCAGVLAPAAIFHFIHSFTRGAQVKPRRPEPGRGAL